MSTVSKGSAIDKLINFVILIDSIFIDIYPLVRLLKSKWILFSSPPPSPPLSLLNAWQRNNNAQHLKSQTLKCEINKTLLTITHALTLARQSAQSCRDIVVFVRRAWQKSFIYSRIKLNAVNGWRQRRNESVIIILSKFSSFVLFLLFSVFGFLFDTTIKIATHTHTHTRIDVQNASKCECEYSSGTLRFSCGAELCV